MKLIALILVFAATIVAQETNLNNLRTAKGDALTTPELPKSQTEIQEAV